MLYGSCYYPEHREPNRWEEDLSLMQQAGLNALRIGEFAWKRFEPVEGDYEFHWLDRFIELAGQYGIRSVLCPPMRTVPAWLVERAPDLLIVTNEGHRLEYASRYTFCINHALLREKSASLAAALASRYGSNPHVIGWHLDNEIGDEPDCHCLVCKVKWQQWLSSKYNQIDVLNEAWGTVFWSMEYDHFGQIPTPRITKADYNPGFLQAWREFRSDCSIDTVTLLSDAIRPHLPEHGPYITTNNQMYWSKRTDYYKMARYLDITGTNYYPPYGENCDTLAFGLAANRSFKKAPFHVYELRNEGHSIIGAANNTPAPGELERLTLHTIANGADGVFYFPWKRFPFGSEQNHGAITDFDGKPTRMYDECGRIGKQLRRVALQIEGSLIISDIAVLYDFQSRWHIECDSPWTGDKRLYEKQINMLYRTVRALGYNCDAVGINGDFSSYKLLLVPMLPIVDDELVMKLKLYAEAGGIILFHPMSGIKNADACYYPNRLHPEMIKLLGSRTLETVTSNPLSPVTFQWNGEQYQGSLFLEIIQMDSAQVLGTFIDHWFEGSPTITKQSIGEGHVWFVATFAEERFYRDFISLLCQQIGMSPLLNAVPPTGVEVSMRQSACGASYTFVINNRHESAEITLPSDLTDIWNGEHLSQNFTLQPYQVRILTDAGKMQVLDESIRVSL
ncbi:beta-galactosidase [Paenibacillus sp. UNC451MF]|uniref:beta-galactosidase n=1 Tax=Paenibacillus sp. UNC451MF TaxID=1449063 RepID=UPI00048E0595|nr:beta-galactosidase [Paenibacillus sp. UNC451MF]